MSLRASADTAPWPHSPVRIPSTNARRAAGMSAQLSSPQQQPRRALPSPSVKSAFGASIKLAAPVRQRAGSPGRSTATASSSRVGSSSARTAQQRAAGVPRVKQGRGRASVGSESGQNAPSTSRLGRTGSATRAPHSVHQQQDAGRVANARPRAGSMGQEGGSGSGADNETRGTLARLQQDGSKQQSRGTAAGALRDQSSQGAGIELQPHASPHSGSGARAAATTRADSVQPSSRQHAVCGPGLADTGKLATDAGTHFGWPFPNGEASLVSSFDGAGAGPGTPRDARPATSLPPFDVDTVHRAAGAAERPQTAPSSERIAHRRTSGAVASTAATIGAAVGAGEANEDSGCRANGAAVPSTGSVTGQGGVSAAGSRALAAGSSAPGWDAADRRAIAEAIAPAGSDDGSSVSRQALLASLDRALHDLQVWPL